MEAWEPAYGFNSSINIFNNPELIYYIYIYISSIAWCKG